MKIQEITKEDFKEIRFLFYHYLNSGKGIDFYLNNLFFNETMTGLKYVTDDNSIAAVLICSESIAFTIPKPELEKKVADIVGNDLVYTIDAIITKETYRNMKLQHKLVNEMNSLLKEKSINWILLEQWIKAGQLDCNFSLDSHYQTKYNLGIFPDFYHDITEHHIICPVCKDMSNCCCGANINLYQGLL